MHRHTLLGRRPPTPPALAALGLEPLQLSANDAAILGFVKGGTTLFENSGDLFLPTAAWLANFPSPKAGSNQTAKTYAHAIDHFFRFLLSIGLDWTAVRIETLFAYWRARRRIPPIEQRLSKRSWNTHSAAIASFFYFAFRNGLIETLPFERGEVGDRSFEVIEARQGTGLNELIGRPIPKWITIDQYMTKVRPAAMASRNPVRDVAICDLLVTTGWRRGEAAAQLKKDWPDPDAPEFKGHKTIPYRLTLGTKGGTPRPIDTPLRKPVVRTIRHYIEADRALAVQRWGRDPDEAFLTDDAMPLGAEGVSRVVKAAFLRAGVDGSAHPLRHTYAVHQLHAMGRKYVSAKSFSDDAFRAVLLDPLRTLQLLLGHASIETTTIYLDMLPDVSDFLEESVEDWAAGIGAFQ